MTTVTRSRINADRPETNPGQGVPEEEPSHSRHAGGNGLSSSCAFCLSGTHQATNASANVRIVGIYEDLAHLDGCTTFPSSDRCSPGARADQKRQNKAIVSLGNVCGLCGRPSLTVPAPVKRPNEANVNLGRICGRAHFEPRADLARTKPFFTQSSLSARTLGDRRTQPGGNRANEAIAVIAIDRAGHPSTSPAEGNRQNEPSVNLGHLCGVDDNTGTTPRDPSISTAGRYRHLSERVEP